MIAQPPVAVSTGGFLNYNIQISNYPHQHMSQTKFLLSSGLKFLSGFFLFFLVLSNLAFAQNSYELNSGWQCAPADSVKANGYQLSTVAVNTGQWMHAVVPGTVLTSLLQNKKIPDPFYGLNNEQIPDIYNTGKAYYTYWFVKDFHESPPTSGGQVYLDFRGVNYSCDVYLNGHKLNKYLQKGMFLRFSYNITPYLAKNGSNRMAVIVYPPDVVGNPNGGQGGDGTIARNVGLQYTAGWDWIQPVRDRNTGIWDKVTIRRTGPVRVYDVHVITDVPGKRFPDGPQQPAIIKVSASVSNATGAAVDGALSFRLGGKTVSQQVTLKPHAVKQVSFKDYVLQNPKLWWPNGYGAQNLYPLSVSFSSSDRVSDIQSLKIGVRQIETSFNQRTGSRQVAVNGQKIFIKGGNWIVSDEMLRLSAARYDAEVRFHRDMNLNLIRVWGGAMIERPEFYDACDKYGILVFQDFWGSGDCNGRWQDPKKLDDQWARRNYPDDHRLFLQSAADQIKMVRNHPSLAIWCGGNEITPPEDILTALRDTLLPQLDSTRWFVEYSNSDAMSRNLLGGNGDGPYGLQPLSTFWQHRTFPFNSEVGSVGLSDYQSLKRFIPAADLVAPVYNDSTGKTQLDKVWDYHKYIGYDTSISRYGEAKDAEDFAFKAQLVNYDQYRGLAEGFTSHLWDWYTGFIIWKTQNPWTAMRGQMYDYYLDPNACLYGLRHGSEPFHVMYSPVTGMVMIANNTFTERRSLMLVVKTYDMQGSEKLLTQVFEDIGASTVKPYFSIKDEIGKMAAKSGIFLELQVLDTDKKPLTENLYWIADQHGDYSGLEAMKQSSPGVTARYDKPGEVQVTFTNPAHNVPAFFNRVSLIDTATGERILPVFYSDNYISLMPGEQKTVTISCGAAKTTSNAAVEIHGWNTARRRVPIEK